MRCLSYALLLGGVLSNAACGKVEPFTDAAPPEIDAEDHDAEVITEVTLRTRTRGNTPDAPAPAIDVFISLPDGSLGPVGQTDANGELIVEIAAGSTVTAVYPRAAGADLVSFVDVNPGDVVLFGRSLPEVNNDALVPTMRIGWAAQVATATSYTASTPCSAFTSTLATDTSVAITRRADCDDSPFDVFQTARNNTNVVVGWGVQRDVAFVEGSTASLPAWQNPGTINLGMTGLPLVVTSARIDARGSFANGRNLLGAGFTAVPAGGAIAMAQPWTTGGDAIQVTASLTRSASFGQMQIREVRPGDATSVTLASPVTMPWPANLVGSAAAGDSGSLSWILDGEGAFDLQLLVARWNRVNGASTDSFEWTVFLPPGRLTLELPTLPTALATLAPQDTDNFASLNGGIIDFGDDDGYRDAVLRGEIGVFLSFYTGGSVKLVGFSSPANLAPSDLSANPFATVAR